MNNNVNNSDYDDIKDILISIVDHIHDNVNSSDYDDIKDILISIIDHIHNDSTNTTTNIIIDNDNINVNDSSNNNNTIINSADSDITISAIPSTRKRILSSSLSSSLSLLGVPPQRKVISL